MKEVLAHIQKKKQEFAKLPLFEYMRDTSIDPRQRLTWAPFLAPFVMGFRDLNRYDLRKESTTDVIQKLINRHTYEDESHWIWFLEDLEKLGLNESMKLSQSMKFLWGKETYRVRQVCHQIALHTFNQEPIVVLAGIEAIEETGNIAFGITAEVVEELKQTTNKNYSYFGRKHFDVENGHAIGTNEIEKILNELILTDEQKVKSLDLVETIFELFTSAVNEFMENTQKKI
ncbi:MAG: hypothetical protein MJK14_24615 [Rivularia sp. ALOHA_DT_140]|nr:hypothetical protein [Rivularia sp. ALOHA_DT_140]